MFNVNIKGIKEIQKKLNNLEEKAKELDGEQEIPLEKLVNNDFINKHTNHDTFEDFIFESELLDEGEEITEELINSDEFNEYVKNNTDFESWKDMLQTASVEYVQRQMGV